MKPNLLETPKIYSQVTHKSSNYNVNLYNSAEMQQYFRNTPFYLPYSIFRIRSRSEIKYVNKQCIDACKLATWDTRNGRDDHKLISQKSSRWRNFKKAEVCHLLFFLFLRNAIAHWDCNLKRTIFWTRVFIPLVLSITLNL